MGRRHLLGLVRRPIINTVRRTGGEGASEIVVAPDHLIQGDSTDILLGNGTDLILLV